MSLSSIEKKIKKLEFNKVQKYVICVRDDKSGQYYEPGYFSAIQDALRVYGSQLEKKSTIVGCYPEQFTIVHQANWFNDGKFVKVNSDLGKVSDLRPPEKKDKKK